MSINIFHNDLDPLNEHARLKLCTTMESILTQVLWMSAPDREHIEDASLDEIIYWIRDYHLPRIALKAFGSSIYSPKSGAEFARMYQAMLQYCADWMNSHEYLAQRGRAIHEEAMGL